MNPRSDLPSTRRLPAFSARTIACALALSASLFLAACDTLPENLGGKGDTGGLLGKEDKANSKVQARLLTYAEVKAKGEKNSALNARLSVLAPTMAFTPGELAPHFVIPVAAAAGLATEELVKGLGILISDEAAKHSAQFGGYVQDPSWWNDQSPSNPQFAAVELTRTKTEGGKGTVVFDFIALIRPAYMIVNGTAPAHVPNACQLIPVYLLETEPMAKDFGKTMGAVVTVQLESALTNSDGVPSTVYLTTYPIAIHGYDLGKEYLFTNPGPADAKDQKPGDDQTDFSHFFAMPARPATIGASVCVVETDPSKLVEIMAKVGQLLEGQASNAGNSVKNRLSQ